MAKPIPAVQPVTRAVLSLNCRSISLPLWNWSRYLTVSITLSTITVASPRRVPCTAARDSV